MNSNVIWNRRTFLSTVGLTSAAAISPRLFAAKSLFAPKAGAFLACVGFASPGSERIETYRVEDGNWVKLSEAASEAPRALVMHPVLPVLYLAHSTAQHLNLPRGSVSAFNVSSGTLVLLNQQPLALSATHPEHLAISPDGRTLMVSASGGGSYNMLSLAEDGVILPELHALKQTGFGPHALQETAHPHAALFQSSGSAAYASDLGADRVNHFAFEDGVPTVASRVSLASGSGPGHIALHPSGKALIVASQLQAALTVLALDEESGNLGSTLQHFALDAKVSGPLAFEASGNYLHVATTTRSGETEILTFQMQPGTFRLNPVVATRIPSISQPQQLLLRDHELLLAGAGGVTHLALGRNGTLNEQRHFLRGEDAVTIAVQTI